VHQWIPFWSVWYREGKEEWFIHSPRAAYTHLQKARAWAAAEQARARKRGHFNAWEKHAERLAMLDHVLEAFGAVLAQHPTMTLAEACGDKVPPQALRVLPEGQPPLGWGHQTPHPLRRTREL
jgi:hypothetical protein